MTDHVRGDGRVELVEFGDFECPYCADAFPSVQRALERTGDLARLRFRHFPIVRKHPHAERAAEAAEAAGAQGRFWEMHDLLFGHQDDLEYEDLLGYAGKLGLDVDQFADELHEGRHAARVRRDVISAEASGARGTPTFFVGDRRHVGPYDTESLARELEESRTTSTDVRRYVR
jgi:protein-disulfide isomerase